MFRYIKLIMKERFTCQKLNTAFMHKIISVTLVLLNLQFANLYALGSIKPLQPDSVKNQKTLLIRPFKDGEILTFKIRYGFIRAGTAKMKVKTDTMESSRQVYHIQTTAKSSGTFSWIYKVNDVVNSYVDYVMFYPVRFEKKLREGNYKADLYTDYFPADSLAKVQTIRYTSRMKVKKEKSYDVKVPPFSQDVLSSFYFIRLKELEVGKSIFLTNHEKKKVYEMEVIVHRKETIEVEAGKFKCIVVEPIIRGEGLFKKKGSLRIWLTDDEKKIPVQMKSEVFVGDITTELIK